MNSLTSHQIGQQAETSACLYLQRHGFTVLYRNWRTRWCEIDIVAQQKHKLYFIEVKYRQTATHGDGLDYITRPKLSRMIRAADSFVQAKQWIEDYRLGVISVSGLLYDIQDFVIVS